MSDSEPKFLVTGGGGQLATSLDRRIENGVVLAASRLDITDRDAVFRAIREHRPEVVVNAAAYTQVDRAESEPELAHAVNVSGVEHLANACREVGARFVQISTDFVFSGDETTPRRPDDPTGPASVYGRTKLSGEEISIDILGDRALVVRTAWLYAAGHANFVATMIRLMSEREEISVVCDQTGSPTWIETLSGGLLDLVQGGAGGIYHLTDSGEASWYEFALAIEETGRDAGILEKPCRVNPIPTADYPTPATRPSYSVLDKSKTTEKLGMSTPHWRTSLARCLNEWQANENP